MIKVNNQHMYYLFICIVSIVNQIFLVRKLTDYFIFNITITALQDQINEIAKLVKMS